MNRIKGLDTLRAFAVFFVIIQHFGVWFDDTSPSGRLIRYAVIPSGGFGVDLFFVLSGFLITSILLQEKQSGGNFNLIIKRFYIRRALRIFPIYYLLLFFLFSINYPDVRRYFSWFATYTSNILSYRMNTWNSFSHTWTLAVEEQFYLLWPWVIVYTKERHMKYVFLVALLTGILTTYLCINRGHFAPLLLFHSFDAFGIGGLYAWARMDEEKNRQFEKVIKTIIIPALLVYFSWQIAIVYRLPTPMIFLIKTINNIIAIWLIMLVVNNKSARAERYFWGNKALNYIGKISYGIYLYHYAYIGHFFSIVNKFLYYITLPYSHLNKIIHDHHIDYWIEVGIMIGIAAISYHFIELPLLNFKKRFSCNKAELARMGTINNVPAQRK